VVLSLLSFPAGVVLPAGGAGASLPRMTGRPSLPVPMTMTFESTPTQLVSFINELHSLPRFFTVRTLQITPLTPVVEAPKGSDLTKAVRVSMAVSGFTSADLVKPQGGSK